MTHNVIMLIEFLNLPVPSEQHDVGKQFFSKKETRINFTKIRNNCLHYHQHQSKTSNLSRGKELE